MENKVEVFKVGPVVKQGDCCPECKANWDGGDIYEHFKAIRDDETHEYHKYYKDYTDEQLVSSANSYGWTPETPKRFGNVIGMELSYDDPEHYDGVSYWLCPDCDVAWNRWDGKRSERFKKDATISKKSEEDFQKLKEDNKSE